VYEKHLAEFKELLARGVNPRPNKQREATR